MQQGRGIKGWGSQLETFEPSKQFLSSHYSLPASCTKPITSKPGHIVVGDIHYLTHCHKVFWKTFYTWYAFVDGKPNGVVGIAPNDPTMPFKAPVKSPQIVSRILWLIFPLRVHRNRAHNLADDFKQIIKRSFRAFLAFMYTAYAISLTPCMKCMAFITLQPSDAAKSNNLQPFNWLCIIGWSWMNANCQHRVWLISNAKCGWTTSELIIPVYLFINTEMDERETIGRNLCQGW